MLDDAEVAAALAEVKLHLECVVEGRLAFAPETCSTCRIGLELTAIVGHAARAMRRAQIDPWVPATS